jgi:hypothetical protein
MEVEVTLITEARTSILLVQRQSTLPCSELRGSLCAMMRRCHFLHPVVPNDGMILNDELEISSGGLILKYYPSIQLEGFSKKL